MFQKPQRVRPRRKRALLILGLLVTIFVVALGVFLVRQMTHTSPAPPGDSSPPSVDVPKKEEKAVVIAEWGVSFKPEDDLQEVTYKSISRDNMALIGFSTRALEEVDHACTSAAGTIGVLERSQEMLVNQDGSAREPLTSLGGYNYYFTHPQGSCFRLGTDTSENLELLSNQIDLLRLSLTTLKLAY